MNQTMISFRNVDKQFSSECYVLKNVSFDVEANEIHGLIGENGAGKSTLLNILHGIYKATNGDVLIDGQIEDFKSPVEALRYGIAKVHQEVQIVKTLTVGQNIVLGFEPTKWKGLNIDFKEMYDRANRILQQLGCNFTSEDVVDGLSVGEMQMIALARALFHKAKIISFDEPTASLSDTEIENLFNIIFDLKQQGITIIYVSHKLDELFRLTDRISVLRDGQYIGTYKTSSITRDELIRYMVGRDVSNYARRLKPSCMKTEVALTVSNMSGKGFSNISFDLYKGEILGFSGLVGAGRTEIVRALFGADEKTSGTVTIYGKGVDIHVPNDALKVGIGFLTEDRKGEGYIPFMTNEKNMSLAAIKNFSNTLGILNNKVIRDNFYLYAERVKLNTMNPDYLTENLSGGNQQKVILAKWLTTNAKIIIFDEPTKGVDVAAKAEIYSLMEDFVHQGKSIIMVSSELTEVMGMSDNIIVIGNGVIKAKLSKDQFNEEMILKYAMPEE